MESHVGSPLYVICAISNPVQFASRYRLYRQFAAEMAKHPCILYTVELGFGARPFVVTDPKHPHHIQVRSSSEVWHKESLLRIGLSRLPMDWQYVAWVDADISFHNTNWVTDTLDALQHYRVVQLWKDCLDMGPRGEVLQAHKSFCSQYLSGVPRKQPHKYGFWHPGFAWAAQREALDGLGGLMVSPAILGAADHHMALSFIGAAEDSLPGGIHPNYRKLVLDWQALATEVVRHDIGYVQGSIIHHWHGKKSDRRYEDRWQILVKNHFDPLADVRWDSAGLMTLAPGRTKLRDDVRAYFRSRNEDSVDGE